MSDTSTKRALVVAKFHEVSEELYADNPEDSGRRAMHHMSAKILRALAGERDALRAALKTARRDALEEAARIAENEPEPEGAPPPELHGRSVKNIATASVRATKRSIATAIRALGDHPQATTSTEAAPCD